MKTVDFIGIDVSKGTLDAHLHKLNKHRVFDNDIKGFKRFVKWLIKYYESVEELAICLEHTGLYSEAFTQFLFRVNISYVLVSGLEIKRSMGIQRGKNDKIDAKAIAQYLYKNHEGIKFSRPASKNILQIKKLLTLRSMLVKQRAAHKKLMKEKSLYEINDRKRLVEKTAKKMIQVFNVEIKEIEQAIKTIVKGDPAIDKNLKLACSVNGIGEQTALLMLVTTGNFKQFSTWRKFACYSGVAPFEHKSGTSVRGKTRISHMANKKMKALLSTAAIVAIRHNPELKVYYERRVNEGKNKMSTINIIRNKLIARVFATVKRQTPYVILNNY